MTITAQPQTDRPDPSVIAAQNDAFRKLACLGVPPVQPIQGRMHVTGVVTLSFSGRKGQGLVDIQAKQAAIFHASKASRRW